VVFNSDIIFWGGKENMRIVKYLNTNEEEVKSRKFNIFLGISLGNRYFSKEHIRRYIVWALENTKESVLVLIADKIHSINYEVLNGYKKERALQVALRRGFEVEDSIKKIVRSLPKEKQNLVKICRWESARNSSYYKRKIKIFLKEYNENKEFHDFIIKIVQENLGGKVKNLEKEKLEKLSLYILDELPILLNGVEFEDRVYNLHPYPGLTYLDDLLMGLQESKLFKNFAKKLEIKNKIAIVEAYTD